MIFWDLLITIIYECIHLIVVVYPLYSIILFRCLNLIIECLKLKFKYIRTVKFKIYREY